MARKNRHTISSEECRSFILQLFAEMGNQRFSANSIAGRIGGNTHTKGVVRSVLLALTEQGIIDRDSRNRFGLTKSQLPHYEGIAMIAQSGAMFVSTPELECDVLINRHAHNRALDGDRVEITAVGNRRTGQFSGEVVKVLERSQHCYAGVATVTPSAIFVQCDSKKIPDEVYLSRRRYPDVESGDRLAIRITDWAEGQSMPTAELVDNLGREGDNDAEMNAIMVDFNLPYRFTKEVEAEAEAIDGTITDKDIAERRDMRHITTFTIDPATAKDFDDALSIKRLDENLTEVGIHIADVTHYVSPGSLLDEEAYRRGTSVYLVDRTVPMLPERLSNGLCSLRPDEDKLCFSAIFTLNEKGEIQNEWFGRTIIRSCRRFNYDEAQLIIDSGEGDLADEIGQLHRLAQTLRESRLRNGALAFNRPESRFTLDDNGHPTGIQIEQQGTSHQLIEEFMLLANRRVAYFCARRNGRPRTMIFRVHDTPDEDRLTLLRDNAGSLGYRIDISDDRRINKELNRLLCEVHGTAVESMISMLALRSMAKAEYSTDNIGHYGLGFPYYTHFTSPIRRYPDMIVHRLLQQNLEGARQANKEALEEQAKHCSEREVVAAEAERASIKYKMAEFMLDKIGQEFDGRITGISESGLYVEIIDTPIEGIIRMRDIGDDYYILDAKRYELYAERSNITLRLGDVLRIRVKGADLRAKSVNFEVVEIPMPNDDNDGDNNRFSPKIKHRR